jgi:hypothetical protein
MSNTGGEYIESGNKLSDAATSTNYQKLNEAELVEVIPVATYVPDYVKVSAPSHLPEGYQFTVIANNLRLIVAVVRDNCSRSWVAMKYKPLTIPSFSFAFFQRKAGRRCQKGPIVQCQSDPRRYKLLAWARKRRRYNPGWRMAR